LPCQVYNGKCVLLNSFRSPDLYFDFLKKCSALYLQAGKFELLGMHALVHLSGPVLPRLCCWLPIHHSMKCVKTICTTNIVNIFYSYTLLLQMSCASQNIQWIVHNETIQKISIYILKTKKISIFQHWSTVNTCVLGLHGQNVWTTSLNVMLSCMF
jgi:hypothetical protein